MDNGSAAKTQRLPREATHLTPVGLPAISERPGLLGHPRDFWTLAFVELWERFGHEASVFDSGWPAFDAELARDESVQLAEQVKGRRWKKEARRGEREEPMMNMLLMSRGQMPGMSGMPGFHGMPGLPALPAPSMPPLGSSVGPTADQAAATALGGAYEGQIIKGDASNPVYKVEGGRKRWILSPDIFNRLGLNWNSIVTLPQATVDKIQFGTNIT